MGKLPMLTLVWVRIKKEIFENLKGNTKLARSYQYTL